MAPFSLLSAHEARSEPAVRVLGGRFMLTYALIAAVLFSLYCFPFEFFGVTGDWLSPYLAAYARLAGACLHVFEPTLVVVGNTIVGRFSLEIIRSCDAIEVNLLFASAVLAFPAPLARKASALVVGLAALVALNILRICSLYYVGVYAPTAFERLHLEVWPLLLIGAATLAFFLGARWLGRVPSEAPSAPVG